MTIAYSGRFMRLLFRWKGSLWRMIWRELLIYLVMYYTINLIFRFGNWSKSSRQLFVDLVKYCQEGTDFIPLNYLFGFFVSTIINRWWDQCKAIPWVDAFVTLLATHLNGQKYVVLRRTLARWLNLMSVLGWMNISLRVRKRFPTVEHLARAGLMTEEELKLYRNMESNFDKWWLPSIWIGGLLSKLHQAKIIDSVQLQDLMREMIAFRSRLSELAIYDWVNLPLVYTQVVAIATYGFFGLCLLGRQMHGLDESDFYVPIATILQFLFYVGWLKVGEDLMNPFGEDDDDFELNIIVDQNFEAGFLMVDKACDIIPQTKPDVFIQQNAPLLPHTKASRLMEDNIFEGHMKDLNLSPDEMAFVDNTSENKTGGAHNLAFSFTEKQITVLDL